MDELGDSEAVDLLDPVPVLNDRWGCLERIIFYYTLPSYINFVIFLYGNHEFDTFPLTIGCFLWGL